MRLNSTSRLPWRPSLRTALRGSSPTVREGVDSQSITFMREVCTFRKYLLRAINVRTNHVHSVVSAMTKPEPILDAFKSYSTRALRKAGLISDKTRPWIRHGSTIYLWKERDVAKAIEYVMLEQGDDLFRLDDDEDESK